METPLFRTEMVQPLIVSDSKTNEDPHNLSRSLDKENECCLPPYKCNQGNAPSHRPYANDRLMVTIANADRTACSSSCENLRVSREKDSIFETSRLAKANSDNPVFGSQSSNCMPPIPPRDYLWHAPVKTPKAIEIHPVLQDGEKLSNTHYWLLPGKQHYAKDSCCYDEKKKNDDGNYMNIKEIIASEKAKRNSELSKNQLPSAPGAVKTKLQDLKGRLMCDGRSGLDDDEPLLDAGCDVSCEGAYDNMTIRAMLDPEIKFNGHPPNASCYNFGEKCTSLGEAKDMIDAVHSAVEGVTLDECQTALSLLQWNTDAAIKYLKIESLFRLALASRERCKQVLQSNGWELNKAASDLLDFSAM